MNSAFEFYGRKDASGPRKVISDLVAFFQFTDFSLKAASSGPSNMSRKNFFH